MQDGYTNGRSPGATLEERERGRVAALESLGAVRPEVDDVLQALVDDVREVFGTDLALVNLILPDIQYFRAWSGDLPPEFAESREVAREHTMCQYVVQTEPVKAKDLDAVLRRWTSRADRTPAAGAEGERGAPDAPPPLDPAVIATLRSLNEEGEPDLLAELAGMFLDDAARRLEELRGAVGEADAGRVRGISHALKGSSGNLGAARVSEVCAKLEELGESGDLAAAPRLLGRLEEELALARPALEAEVAEGSNARP